MVFYFTGTGNSLYVARQMDREVRSIPQVLRTSERSFSAPVIGLVCPIYGHEMPAMVKDFLQQVDFQTDYFYLLLTYGNRHANAVELAQAACRQAGKRPDSIHTVLMVDNFLPVFDMEEQLRMDKQVERQLDRIRQDIELRKQEYEKVTMADRAAHASYCALVGDQPETVWANYVITDQCIGCGICTRVCPAGCIHLEGRHAVNTGENCQACYACIHACPELAIQFGQLPIKSKMTQARYRNPHVSLTDLVQSNDQTRQGVHERE
ncbi:MAG: EFR1 family ferrodoxin [Faecalibacterium sp.]